MRIILMIALVAVFSLPVMAEEKDSTVKKEQLALKLLEALPIQTQFDRAVEPLLGQIPIEQQHAFMVVLRKNFDLKRLEEASFNAYVKTFTVDELAHMLAFYNSPLYDAIQQKMPQYNAVVNPLIQEMVYQASVDWQNTHGR